MNDTLTLINEDLSDAEKAQVETMKADLEATLTSQKQQFSDSIDQAATASRSHLQALKDKYLNKAE